MLVSKSRLLSLLFAASVGLFCYFCYVSEVAEHHRGTIKGGNGDGSREIVAFSLLKRIEIESEEYKCDKEILSEGNVEENWGEKWIRLGESNLFVYSIYRDQRLYPYEYLRIVGMVEGIWNSTIFCQIPTQDGHFHITKATATKIWSNRWNQNDTHVYYNPYLISCNMAPNITTVYLSLSKNPCQIGPQKFTIPVTIKKKSQNSFTVCVKPLNYQIDIFDHLLQWIIINRILGADKIEFYVENVPTKTLESLQKLEKFSNGGVILHQHHKIGYNSTPSEATYIWQKRRYEIITYNDCLYRNLHTSEFVIPIDVDEIIAPRQVSTWAELLHGLMSKNGDNYASYTVRNAYYLRHFNVNKSMETIFFLKDVVRSDFSDEGESGKSFISTKNSLTVFNHYALESLRPGIERNMFLSKDLVQMNHYKNDCDIVILPECAKYLSSPVRILDGVMLKYKTMFYERYRKWLHFRNLD